MTDTMETRNAVITHASLGVARDFILDSWLTLDYGGEGQGFGGFALYLSKTAKHHTIESCAGHWIWRVMQIAGVEKWDDIKGRTIRVRCTHDRVHAIGHIVRDDWFDPAAEFAKANLEKAGGVAP